MAIQEQSPLPLLHVLLAEDDPIVARLTVRALERRGLIVKPVTTGRAVLDEVRARRFDLLLLDLGLPQLDGLGVSRRLRAQPEHASLFIIALTAAERPEEEWRSAGIDAILAKPLDVEALERLLLARASGASGEGDALTLGAGSPIDFEALRERTGGDEDLIREVFADFLAHEERWLDELREAVFREAFGEAAKLAHRLRGALLALGASPAGQLAAGVEERAGALAKGDGGGNGLASEALAFEQAVRKASDAMRLHVTHVTAVTSMTVDLAAR